MKHLPGSKVHTWSDVAAALYALAIVVIVIDASVRLTNVHPYDPTSCTVTTPYHPNTTAVILMDDGHCKVVTTP